MTPACPNCGAAGNVVRVPASEVRRESDLREGFVTRRLDHRPEQLERMDLTDFMHGKNGQMVACARCGLLYREDGQTADYTHDTYDPALMGHLYPRYLQAFRQKEPLYKPLLRNHAEVIEVGSHLGAFLQSAEEWGWRPMGLDIGQSTSDFARRRGLSVERRTLHDYSPRLKRPDAIFIWNCFEQLEDPAAALRESYGLLDRHGLLVVRVPSAQFYQRTRRQLMRGEWEPALRVLGYNNLLGFPYLYGYSSAILAQMLRRNGFEPVAGHNSTVLTPPYPEMRGRVKLEWNRIGHEERPPQVSDGPWIELAGRRM